MRKTFSVADRPDRSGLWVVLILAAAFLVVVALCGGAGALVGYGASGTATGACLGAGVAVLVLFFICVCG